MRAVIEKNAAPLITEAEWAVAQEQLKTTPRDPTVGISIVPVKIENGVGTYATVIDPGKAASVHFHPRGNEEYQIISGNAAAIKLLTLEESRHGRTEPDSAEVKAGDSFTIPAGCMHQLVNTGQQSTVEPLVLIFRCTKDHLTEDNRVLTPGWKPPAATPPALHN